jgi:O-succinylbenzoate synthase
MVDANAAYRLAQAPHLARLDRFELMMIEQPLEYDDIRDHAALQHQIRTPICLDESIHSPRVAEEALALGACRIVNIKPGRLGGHAQSIRVHDICAAQGVPVWHGGMLESGTVAVPTGPGIGVHVDWERVKAATVEEYEVRA